MLRWKIPKIHNHSKIDECSVSFNYIHGSCQFAPIRSRKIKIVQDIETCKFKLLLLCIQSKIICLCRLGFPIRKFAGSFQTNFDPRISEWGNPICKSRLSCSEYIGVRGEPGELKHLSTPRKRNQTRFPK